MVFDQDFGGFGVEGVLYWELAGIRRDSAFRRVGLDVKGLSEGVPVWHST
jgi:hypothetical protein